MKARELDKKFDTGEDITGYLDMPKAERPAREQRYPMKKYVAFFDLDHTILDTSSARLYIRYLYKKGEIGRWDLARGVFLSILHRLGLFATDDVIKKWVMKYRGKSEREMLEHIEHWFNTYVVPRIRDKAVLEIERHKQNGARTVLLSASTNYGCDPVRDHLGMDDVISTRLAVQYDCKQSYAIMKPAPCQHFRVPTICRNCRGAWHAPTPAHRDNIAPTGGAHPTGQVQRPGDSATCGILGESRQ